MAYSLAGGVGRFLLAAIVAVIVAAGCAPPMAPLPTSSPVPTAAAGQRLAIYAPATPSSVPVIMAARAMGADVTIYSNQSQANTLFLRGDVPIFVTGLSVGVEFFKNG